MNKVKYKFLLQDASHKVLQIFNISAPYHFLRLWGDTRCHIAYSNIEERNKHAMWMPACLWTILIDFCLCFRYISKQCHQIESVSPSFLWYASVTMVMTRRGGIIKQIAAGGCSYIYLVGDFSFTSVTYIPRGWHIPEEEQLVVIPFVMRSLRMTDLGECASAPLHPEDEEVIELQLR